jgi:hypothetical protein
MEQNSLSYEEKLYTQIEDAYGKLLYTYTTQIIHAGRIKRKNQIIKWAQIILSAISTGGFIGTIIINGVVLLWVGGLCSTALLVLTAYLKDTDLAATYVKHLETSNQLWCLREEYISLLTDCMNLSTDEIVSKRDELQKRTASIYSSAPITDNKSYEMAKKALKENKAQFFTRDELNMMLPISLRK